jgi:polyhydroxyalkanoate synthesis regulator phasin
VPADLVRQEQQHRTEELAARPEQVVVDVVDAGEIGKDDATKLRDDLFEELAHRSLDVCQLRRLRAEHSGP